MELAYKTKVELPYDVVDALLGVLRVNEVSITKRHLHIHVISVLRTTAKMWNEPRYPSAEESIKTTSSDCYSAIRKTVIQP